MTDGEDEACLKQRKQAQIRHNDGARLQRFYGRPAEKLLQAHKDFIRGMALALTQVHEGVAGHITPRDPERLDQFW